MTKEPSNTIDLTFSGSVLNYVKLPDGELYYVPFHWKPFSSQTIVSETINLINIESFLKKEYPICIFDIEKRPGMNWLQRLLSFPNERYVVKFNCIGTKKLTLVTMRSGKQFLCDQSVDDLKNSLNNCIWPEKILKDLFVNL